MSEPETSKIQELLRRAEGQTDSSNCAGGSIAQATRVFSNAAEIEENFALYTERILRVGKWNAFSAISSFELFDQNGKSQPEKSAQQGDFVKITLPGSGKDDWVKVIEIFQNSNEFILTVQPSHNPLDPDEKQTVSHFFTDESTNNFCLQKTGARINFYVIGLNEKTNVSETGGLMETVRNLATSNVGYFLGIQKTQWETFCENLLEIEQ